MIPRTRTVAGLLLGFCALTSAARADETAVANAKARLEAARKVYEGMFKRNAFDPAPLDFEKLNLWSRRWMEAERELGDKKEDKIAAVQGHLERMKKLEGIVKEMLKSGVAVPYEVAAQEYYRLEAEQWLAREKGK